MEKVVNKLEFIKSYKGKKIFITGHTGFKGAWLAAWLHRLGAILKGYALEPEHKESLYNLLEPHGMIDSIIADIRDKKKLTEALLSFEPDYVFHLAAQPLVRRSYVIPSETFEVNAIGTANLLEAVSHLKGKCTIVIVTTDKVYENKEINVLYNEDDTLGGHDPYSASKACVEIITASFRNSFFIPSKNSDNQKGIATARAGNVIGGGDFSDDRIIPDIIRALQHNQVIQVRNPFAIRPWQHVLEPIAGYLLLGSLLNEYPEKYSKAYNFGPVPSDHITVKELVEAAIHNWGNGKWADISNEYQPHEASLLKLDIKKAIKELSWNPKLSSAEAIEWAIKWYKQDRQHALAFSFEQIENYMQL